MALIALAVLILPFVSLLLVAATSVESHLLGPNAAGRTSPVAVSATGPAALGAEAAPEG